MLVLLDQVHEILEAQLAMKNFAFAIDHVLLQIICSGLADAEILHGIRHLKPHLFCKAEEMVHGVARSQDDSGVFTEINALLPEFLTVNAFHVNEGPKINGQLVLLRQIEVR